MRLACEGTSRRCGASRKTVFSEPSQEHLGSSPHNWRMPLARRSIALRGGVLDHVATFHLLISLAPTLPVIQTRIQARKD